MAVVAALKLDDLVSAGVRAHDAEHGEARLGTGVAEADHLDGGDAVDHHLAEDVLELAGSAEGGALVDLRLERGVDLVVGVAADGGTPGADVVDVLVAVDVEAVGILDLVEDDGTAADGLERAHGGVHAAGEDVLGSLENLRITSRGVYLVRYGAVVRGDRCRAASAGV